MHASSRTLALGLSTFLLLACASSPQMQSPSARVGTVSSTQSPAHATFFAQLVATVAALGGSNPNPAYRALNAKNCVRQSPVPTGRQPLNDQPSTNGLPRTTVSAQCQRVAAAK